MDMSTKLDDLEDLQPEQPQQRRQVTFKEPLHEEESNTTTKPTLKNYVNHFWTPETTVRLESSMVSGMLVWFTLMAKNELQNVVSFLPSPYHVIGNSSVLALLSMIVFFFIFPFL